jgi:hypothetical protein
METFINLFGKLIVFVYHCFDRIVINGYLSMLSRPENVVYFFRQVVGEPVITKEVLAKRTEDYQSWVEAFARNHHIPMQWAEKGVRKEEFIEPFLHRMSDTSSTVSISSSRAWNTVLAFAPTSPSFQLRTPTTEL